MLLPQLHTAKAGDGRHGQRQTAAFGLLPRRHDVCGGVALAHPLQYRVAAEAVDDPEPGPPAAHIQVPTYHVAAAACP